MPLLILISACGEELAPNIPEYETELNIAGTISPNLEFNSFYVSTSTPITEGFGSDNSSSSTTVVQVSNGSETVTLSYNNFRNMFIDANNELNITPGETYSVYAEDIDGHIAEGSTVVPGDFSILSPSSGDLVLGDTLKLRWTESKYASAYRIMIYTDETLPWPFNDEESGIVFFEWVAEDTTIILPPGLTEFIFPIDGDYNMMVMATDTNYYDYFRNEEDPLNRFHLDRGIGYFGSMVVQQKILTITSP